MDFSAHRTRISAKENSGLSVPKENLGKYVETDWNMIGSIGIVSFCMVIFCSSARSMP